MKNQDFNTTISYTTIWYNGKLQVKLSTVVLLY